MRLPTLTALAPALTTALALALGPAAMSGCAAPLDVRRADVRDVYAEIDSHTLNGGGLSTDTVVTFDRAGLSDTLRDDPRAALARLHDLAAHGDRRARLFALAEACFATAEAEDGDPDLFVASATYAYQFLFGGDDTTLPGPFRRRFRRACDLYGTALALAFTDDDGVFVPRGGRFVLPRGWIDVAPPQLPLHFAGFAYEDLTPAITIDVDGLRARAIRSGIGAPLVARRREGSLAEERRAHLAPRSAMAVTAVLLVGGGTIDDAAESGLTAHFAFHEPDGVRDIEIAGREVPIEFDVTAPLAWELAESRQWESEISGFLDNDDAGVRNALYLTEPYQPGRIPVLFVHGTASSPSRWAEILNELHDDGLVAGNCQFWIYQYGTGGPVLASAAALRSRLERVLRDLDPDGTDDALQQIVVVGHSQGGLLSRLLVTESGDRFWGTVSDTPFDALELDDSERRYGERLFFFEPSPAVSRAIFVATPHRGSHVAGSWVGRLGASLVSIPKDVLRGAGRLARRIAGRGLNLRNFSTAVDDMSPGSAFLGVLEDSPIAARVTAHSIVAIDGDEAPPEGDDGIVEYTSAHLTHAASEVVVRSFHSCQDHPDTVAEIRRVLHEHLRALGR